MKQSASVKKIKLALLAALDKCSILLPFALFSGFKESNPHAVNFFLPSIVAYTVIRACLVSLRGFGSVQNPYRIMKTGLAIGLLGGLFTLAAVWNETLLTVGAVLIGIGFAPYSGMYTPLYNRLIKREPELGNSEWMGYLFLILFAALMTFLKKSTLYLDRIFFCLYTACALWCVCTLEDTPPYGNLPAFDKTKRNRYYFFIGFMALLCLLVLRQYKTSGRAVFILIAPMTVALCTVVDANRHRVRKPHVFKTYWAGAMRNITVTFALIYNVSVGNGTAVTYLLLTIGNMLSGILEKAIRKIRPGADVAWVAMYFSVGFAFFHLLPGEIWRLLGIVLCYAFAGVVSITVEKDYQQDERFAPEDRALTKYRVFCIGGIMAQTMLFFGMFLLGERMGGVNLLAAYASSTSAPELGNALSFVYLFCMGIMLLAAIGTALLSGKPERINR